MVSRIGTFAFNGIEALDVDVQCQLTPGLPNFSIVGLADKAVAESRERIRAVFSSIGLAMPPKKIIINLSPADIIKEGSHFDLAIMLSLLAAMKLLPQEEMENFYAIGEISLDGSLVPVSGVLPAAIQASAAHKGLICPKDNAQEALWASDDLKVLPARNVLEIVSHFKGHYYIATPKMEEHRDEVVYPDFRDVKGQETAKRAAEIAASGGHNMLMIGPPGSGKSMIASRMPGIIPNMSSKEILETSMIYSVSGSLREGRLVTTRPYRAPHHNTSMPALIGGGTKAKPGEVSLAHNGILFLDEFPEFPRQVLDSLRQPLENRDVTVSRVRSHATYPADFQLVAAMNPCKCGYLADTSRACSKAPKCATEYQNKLSGPLLDRIDIHVEVPAQNPMQAFEKASSESSSAIRARVAAAHDVQKKRYAGTNIKNNSHIVGEDLEKYCILENDSKELLAQASDKFRLSMRGHTRVLRVARTVADMDSSETIKRKHMAEALVYRQINYAR